MSKPADKAEAFVNYLQSLHARGDRAALAVLRRCLAVDLDEVANLRAYRYLAPFLQGEPWQRQRAYWLLAGLYAHHPTDAGTKGETLPAALGRLFYEEGQQAVERRFLALLEADADQLGPRLRRVIGILRSKNVALDYAALLRDLLGWFAPARRVQMSWAQEFYGAERSRGEERPA